MYKYYINIFLLLSTAVYGQSGQELNYKGTLIIDGGGIIPYELILTIDDTLVQGISISGEGTEDETSSEVQGKWKDDLLILSEIQVLETKSESPLDEFCYVNLKAEMLKNDKSMRGEFVGIYPDSSSCAKGLIVAAKKDYLEKVQKKITKKLDKRVKKAQAEVKHLDAKDTLSIDWKSDSIMILLWDANTSDGDKIDLYWNKDTLLRNQEVYSKLKVLNVYVGQAQNFLEIKALNVGEVPPNTVRFELIDAKKRYPVVTQIEENQSVVIRINKD